MKSYIYRFIARASCLMASLVVAACSGPAVVSDRSPQQPAQPRCAAQGAPWTAGQLRLVDELLKRDDLGPRPVAVFDWDNTVIKNDVGAAVVHHLVRGGLAFRPPSWDAIPYLTPAARARLSSVCAGDGPRLPSAEENPACARELVMLYEHRTLANGAAGFAGYNHRAYKPSAAWQVHLLAGHTPDRVRRMARQVIARQCAAPVGRTDRLAGVPINGYIRLYRPMAGLIQRLRARGFDIWVVSASPQQVVEVFADQVGIPADHVVGIRALLDGRGRLTRDFVGCGAVRDGDNSMIAYIEGKRCWIRKVIGRVPVLAAGDSVTDVAFLSDATGLRIVVDRGYPELMCRALFGRSAGEPWLVTPMFLEPKPKRATPYPCATSACVDTDGASVPCRTPVGAVMPDLSPN